MNFRSTILILALAGAATLALSLAATDAGAAGLVKSTNAAGAAKTAQIERGRYLVTIMGCNDCHTPLKMGAHGPEPDMARMLSGHPESLAITEPPSPSQGPWMAQVGSTMTAWAGPWGVSFTANLTPDDETGLGLWTPEAFIATIRSGRHQVQGRPILPPMPWQMIRNATDDDLLAIFAYLQSIPAVKNHVPQPIDPAQAR